MLSPGMVPGRWQVVDIFVQFRNILWEPVAGHMTPLRLRVRSDHRPVSDTRPVSAAPQ